MMTGFNLHGSNSILRTSGCSLGAVLSQMIKHGAAAETNKQKKQFNNGIMEIIMEQHRREGISDIWTVGR